MFQGQTMKIKAGHKILTGNNRTTLKSVHFSETPRKNMIGFMIIVQCRSYQNLTKIYKNLTDYLTNFTRKSDQNLTVFDYF